MKLNKLRERFKLWKFKKKHSLNGKFPVTLDFYKELIITFGDKPILELETFIDYITSERIALYTADIYELRTLLNITYKSMMENKGFNNVSRLSSGRLEDVQEKYFRTYMRIYDPSSLEKQKNALIDCLELTLSCIKTVENGKKNDKEVSNYYIERILLLSTDLADIYYALIVFYLGK